MKHETEDERWRYNCEDTVRTLECAYAERTTIAQLGLQKVEASQQSMLWPVLRAMQLGVRIDTHARGEMAATLLNEMSAREAFFHHTLGHPLNPRSFPQMTHLFYDDLQLPIQLNRKTRQPTLNDDALSKLAAREPLIRPIIKAISEYRTLGVFLSTFVRAPLDEDGRMRCSYNVCGTETYRLSSSENAFGSGTNLQNLPKGLEAKDPEDLSLPNIRRLFIPDPGYTFFDLDLDRADLQVVVWEADDVELKEALRSGVDIHQENAKVLGISRQLAKSWVHGTDYGGGPRTMAAACGITIHEAEQMRKRWFAAHPGIKEWHDRTESFLHTRRYVENRFGYRRFYFDRIEGILPEALAWVPQSTVAITINRIWKNVFDGMPEVQILLQVHDSLAGQFPTNRQHDLLPELRRLSSVTIPYPDPLIIPCGIKTSTRSWGDCA